jgi:hypothetical protein
MFYYLIYFGRTARKIHVATTGQNKVIEEKDTEGYLIYRLINIREKLITGQCGQISVRHRPNIGFDIGPM